MFKPLSTALALSLTLASAQAKDTTTVILLEPGEAAPIQCGFGAYAERTEECMKLSESKSKDLHSAVYIEMRLDPECAGMAFAKSLIDVGSFGSYKEIDYINAVVTYFPTTNQKVWWLNIVRINGQLGPDYTSGIAATPKEIAHQLCHIIHQEKITRR